MWLHLALVTVVQSTPPPEVVSIPKPLQYSLAVGIVGVETGARIRNGLIAAKMGVRYTLRPNAGVAVAYLIDGGSQGTELVGVTSSRQRLQLGLFLRRQFRYASASLELGVHPRLSSFRLYGPSYKRKTKWETGFGYAGFLRVALPAGRWGNIGFDLGLLQRQRHMDVWLGLGAEY